MQSSLHGLFAIGHMLTTQFLHTIRQKHLSKLRQGRSMISHLFELLDVACMCVQLVDLMQNSSQGPKREFFLDFPKTLRKTSFGAIQKPTDLTHSSPARNHCGDSKSTNRVSPTSAAAAAAAPHANGIGCSTASQPSLLLFQSESLSPGFTCCWRHPRPWTNTISRSKFSSQFHQYPSEGNDA